MRGSLEQLNATLEQKEKAWQAEREKLLERLAQQCSKAKAIQDEASHLRNDFMILRTYAGELDQNLKSKRIFEEVLKQVKQLEGKRQKELDEARSVVFGKNK